MGLFKHYLCLNSIQGNMQQLLLHHAGLSGRTLEEEKHLLKRHSWRLLMFQAFHCVRRQKTRRQSHWLYLLHDPVHSAKLIPHPPPMLSTGIIWLKILTTIK